MNETSQNLRSTIETFTQQAQFDALIDTCKIALTDARTRDDIATEVMAIMGLALGHLYIGKFKDARILANGALTKAETLHDGQLIARANIVSGEIFLKGSYKPQDAEINYRQALRIAKEIDDTYTATEALCGLGATFLQMDDVQRAQRFGRQAFEEAREHRIRYLMGTSLAVIGGAVTRSQPEKATQAFEDAMAIAQQDNFRLLELQLIGRIGHLLVRDERYADEGQLMLEKAYALAKDFRSVPDEFRAIYRLGHAYEERTLLEQATQYYGIMLERAQDWNARPYEGIAFFNLGILAYNRIHYDDAIANFEQALTIARETNNPFQEAQTEQVLGSCYLNMNDFEHALDHYMAARSIYDSLDNRYMMSIMLQRIVTTYFQRLLTQVMRWLGLTQADDSDVD
ncbi:MAG: tetratricopeptide repeat protein [Chloroflexota bacterium]